MTHIYFIRHAESDTTIHNDLQRPLTPKGTRDSSLITAYLQDKKIHEIYSSPYKRSYDTVKQYADMLDIPIICKECFRERKITDQWIPDFSSYAKKQWHDFEYKMDSGESLAEVQKRNIDGIKRILDLHPDKNIAVASHGTALSIIINYFDSSFTYESFQEIQGLMPWIVHFTFDQQNFLQMESINPFTGKVLHQIP